MSSTKEEEDGIKITHAAEVVQALLDGRVIDGAERLRLRCGILECYSEMNCRWKMDETTTISTLFTHAWSIAPDTYDWAEARKRMAAGKRVRRSAAYYGHPRMSLSALFRHIYKEPLQSLALTNNPLLSLVKGSAV